MHSIVDRSLLSIPGLQTLAEVLTCSTPDRAGCISLLERGWLVGVAPGGGKQAMLGIGWGKRRGYAVAAATARVPVVIMYTENIDLAYSTTSLSWPFSYLLYLSTRIAVAPVYGGLPVQLTTKLAKLTSSINADTDGLKENIDHESSLHTVALQADELNTAVSVTMAALIADQQHSDQTHLQGLASWVRGDVDICQTR